MSALEQYRSAGVSRSLTRHINQVPSGSLIIPNVFRYLTSPSRSVVNGRPDLFIPSRPMFSVTGWNKQVMVGDEGLEPPTLSV